MNDGQDKFILMGDIEESLDYTIVAIVEWYKHTQVLSDKNELLNMAKQLQSIKINLIAMSQKVNGKDKADE